MRILAVGLVAGLLAQALPPDVSAAPVTTAILGLEATDGGTSLAQPVYYYRGGYYPYRYRSMYFRHRYYRYNRWHYY